MKKVLTFFVLGGPGSGKGTLCSDLVRMHNFVHLAAGDLLRMERDSGSPKGDLINMTILEGKIVPVEITVNLIKDAIQKNGWSESKFLIDGFPRNQDNYEGWNRVMSNDVKMPFVIFLECSKETMIKRINKRANESTEVRNDDNMEVLSRRFDTFRDQSMPIIEWYEKSDQVRRIDANGTADEVTQEVI